MKKLFERFYKAKTRFAVFSGILASGILSFILAAILNIFFENSIS